MEKLTVVQLRQELIKRQLKTGGNKADLIRRIVEYDRNQLKPTVLGIILDIDIRIGEYLPRKTLIKLRLVNWYLRDLVDTVLGRSKMAKRFGHASGEFQYGAGFSYFKVYNLLAKKDRGKQLKIAINRSWVPVVGHLIKDIHNLEVTRYLRTAVLSNCVPTVNEILRQGIDINIGCGIAIRTSIQNNLEMMTNFLIGAGAEVYNQAMLIQAIKMNHLQYVHFCIDNRAVIDRDLVRYAIREGRMSIINLFFTKNILMIGDGQ